MRIIELQVQRRQYLSRIIFFTLFAATFFSCSGKNEVIHPRKEFIKKVEGLKETVSMKDQEKTSGRLLPKPVSDIIYIGGGEVGSDNFIVEMKNAVIDDFGRVYISVPSEGTIKVFDKNGKFLRNIGRYGRGPGEFEFLSSIDYHSEKDLLVVLDNKDIEIFSVSESEIKHQDKFYNPATQSTELCLTKNTIIVNGYKVEEKDAVNNTEGLPDLLISPPIHSISFIKTEPTISFGDSYYSEHGWGIFDGILSKMNVQCNEESDIVIGVMDLYPYLIGYDLNSDKKIWESGIIDVNGINFYKEDKRGIDDISLSPETKVDIAGVHKAISLTSIDKSTSLMQFSQLDKSISNLLRMKSEMTKNDYLESVKNISIAINRSTGEMTFIDTNYPSFLNGVQVMKDDVVVLGPVIENEDKGVILAVIQQ